MQPKISTVYLVSCVSKKKDHACPARDLYTSPWFQKASRVADASGCKWFILSAQYRLVEPNGKIAPYDKTLKKMRVAERREWSARVVDQLVKRVPTLGKVVILAGRRYRDFIIPLLTVRKVDVRVPMKGMRIGEQLSWLNDHLNGIDV